MRFFKIVFLVIVASLSIFAASRSEIDADIRRTLHEFDHTVDGGVRFLKKSAGYLVFPNVYKAGLGIGGEYGEGALIVKGKTVGYYNTLSASVGFQLGAQKKSIIIAFLSEEALDKFRRSDGWKIGVDASVALVKTGIGKDIDSLNFQAPVVAFVFANKGLMYNLTLEGTKITKIHR